MGGVKMASSRGKIQNAGQERQELSITSHISPYPISHHVILRVAF